MPLLRPTVHPRYRGYICSSCTAKLQVPRRPPWLMRNATNQAKHQGHLDEHRRPARQAVKTSDDNVQIKYFDETAEGLLEKAPEETLKEDTIEALKSRIVALEAGLQKLSGIEMNPDGKSLVEETLFKEDRLAQWRNLRNVSPGGKFKPPNLRDLGFKGIEIPVNLFPEDRHKGISKLNQALQNFAKQQSNPSYIRELWRWYSHSRHNLSLALHLVPSAVWVLLWDAFSSVGTENPNRTAHIKKLGEDIRAAGVDLNRHQTLLYIESLFIEGSCIRAISEWETAQIALTYDPSTACQYWALGIKMLTQDNQSERAEKITDLVIMSLADDRDARALIPVIRSWLNSDDQSAVQRAWAVYIRLRYILASNMQMKDYDAVAGAFLAVQQTDLALAVFKDMMLSKNKSAQDYDSITLYRRTFTTVKDLRSFRLTPEEKSWTSYDPFVALPKKQQNKYFYGSWIKKLIGDGEVDWAAQVARLAYRHGTIPDSKHMNGIIGAWLRTGTIANQQKAEELGWKMVAARLDFVKTRDEFGLKHQVRAIGTLDKKAFDRPSMFSQISTPATIETFCILLNYYQRRRRGDRVEEVCTAIEAAKIKPNTVFLNDLLLVGAMLNRKNWAWSTYNQFVHEEDVGSDHDTFTILWQMMRDHVKGSSTLGFPSPRILFSEMVKWPPSRKQGALSREAYELVLECFGLAGDVPGAAVALRAMQQLFDLYPNEETVRNIMFHLAQTKTRNVTHRFRADRARDLKGRLSKISGAFRTFEQQRTHQLAEQGFSVDEMDDTSRAEELLLILSSVLQAAAQPQMMHPDHSFSEDQAETDMASIQKILEIAAEEMGVPQFLPISSSSPNSQRNS